MTLDASFTIALLEMARTCEQHLTINTTSRLLAPIFRLVFAQRTCIL